MQLYSPKKKSEKYGLGQFDKWYIGPPDKFLEEDIEKITLVTDFSKLIYGKIPKEVLRSIDGNKSIKWKLN